MLAGSFSIVTAALGAGEPRQVARTVSASDAMQWGIGLLCVLVLFFACVWMMRKLNGFSTGESDKLRVLGGLSLGMREKIILLEVGKKQLVLGVTPGRIETLLVLDEADCLKRDTDRTDRTEGAFAQKLMQVMKGRSDV